MKLTIPWTPLLAVLTLSLGTLAEGAAIATSPHSPTSRPDHQENLVLAQVFNNRCAVVEQDTRLFQTASTLQPTDVTIRAQTYVRLGDNPGNGWHQIRPAFPPHFPTGYIPDRYIGRVVECGPLPPVVEIPPASFACYQVGTADRLPVHPLPTKVSPSRQSLLNGDRVLHLNDGPDNGIHVDGQQIWFKIKSVPTNPLNANIIEGWVELQAPRGNRHNLVSIGVCN